MTIPNPIDKHVGARVRMRRMMLGMSQEKLGGALGITFQQVQKNEKGTNRIGASRLHQVSHILQCPVSFFFDGAPGGVPAAETPRFLSDFMTMPGGMTLAKAFVEIENSKVRYEIVCLVGAIASSQPQRMAGAA